MANSAISKGRINRVHDALSQRYKAQLASMTSEEFREYSHRVLGATPPHEASQDMRAFGYTEEMIQCALKYIYDDDEGVKASAS